MPDFMFAYHGGKMPETPEEGAKGRGGSWCIACSPPPSPSLPLSPSASPPPCPPAPAPATTASPPCFATAAQPPCAAAAASTSKPSVSVCWHKG